MNRRIVLFLTIILTSTLCFSQEENRFRLSLDFSPNLSKIANPIIQNEYKISFNSYINIEIPISKRTNLIAGIGVLNTGEKSSSNIGSLGIDESTTSINFYFVHIPFGIKYYIKNIFISPQTSVALFVYDREKFTILYDNGEEETDIRRIQLGNAKFNKITIPLILTIGREFNAGKVDFNIGIKGYYSLNELISNTPARSNKYFGFGLMFGVKI